MEDQSPRISGHFWDTEQVCEILGISSHDIRNLRHHGFISSGQRVRGYLYTAADIRRLQAALREHSRKFVKPRRQRRTRPFISPFHRNRGTSA